MLSCKLEQRTSLFFVYFYTRRHLSVYFIQNSIGNSSSCFSRHNESGRTEREVTATNMTGLATGVKTDRSTLLCRTSPLKRLMENHNGLDDLPSCMPGCNLSLPHFTLVAPKNYIWYVERYQNQRTNSSYALNGYTMLT